MHDEDLGNNEKSPDKDQDQTGNPAVAAKNADYTDCNE